MKKEYIIIGDNNFWYASCIGSLKEAKELAKEIKEEGNSGYGCAICSREPCCEPTKLYIYKAEQVLQIDIPEEKN